MTRAITTLTFVCVSLFGQCASASLLYSDPNAFALTAVTSISNGGRSSNAVLMTVGISAAMFHWKRKRR
jgi:hypothetical protein